MPTLIRMVLVIVLLSGGFLAALAGLAMFAEPESHMISMDVAMEKTAGDGGQ